MRFTHQNQGTCSRSVSFDIDDNGTVSNISFDGGCNGNLQGIAALGEGMDRDRLIEVLGGIKCGFKSTSCPDQFAHALADTKNSNK